MMQRREFLAASAAAALGLASATQLRAAEGGATQFVELRLYTFASPEKLSAYEQFLASTAIPALNRAGVKPVGVFKMTKEENQRATDPDKMLFVLLPHDSIQSFLTLDAKLAADEAYQKAGAAILDAARTSPAYTNVETSLFTSWESVAKVEVPSKAETRVMQLRIYQAHNDEKARRKSAMFVAGGEMAIFRACGMNPVFGGRAVAGPKMPNVTYMLGYDDIAGMQAGWRKFGQHPDWQKLRKDETYKDTDPIQITNLVCRPGAGSQI